MSEHKPPAKKNYREEAARIQAVALQLKSARAREQLLLIAAVYEKLAELSEVSDK